MAFNNFRRSKLADKVVRTEVPPAANAVVVPGAAASPGTLLWQILRLHLAIMNQKLWGWGHATWVWKRPPGDWHARVCQLLCQCPGGNQKKRREGSLSHVTEVSQGPSSPNNMGSLYFRLAERFDFRGKIWCQAALCAHIRDSLQWQTNKQKMNNWSWNPSWALRIEAQNCKQVFTPACPSSSRHYLWKHRLQGWISWRTHRVPISYGMSFYLLYLH